MSEATESCPYCGERVLTKEVIDCPECGRWGCPECMPAGRGCICPDCEDKQEEE